MSNTGRHYWMLMLIVYARFFWKQRREDGFSVMAIRDQKLTKKLQLINAINVALNAWESRIQLKATLTDSHAAERTRKMQ